MISYLLKITVLLNLCITLLFTTIAVQAVEDLSYLGERLHKPGRMSSPLEIGLMKDGHPVTDRIAGKTLSFHFDELYGQVLTGHFMDDKYIMWSPEWGPNTDTPLTSPYVAFEITEDVIFVTWQEPTAMTRTTSVEYEGNWMVAFVLDMSTMKATDAYQAPGDGDGEPVFFVTQSNVTMKDVTDDLREAYNRINERVRQKDKERHEKQ